MKDKNNIEIICGSILDIHQTVNGQNIFIVSSLSPLTVVYSNDIYTRYEYDLQDFFDIDKEEKTIEVVGNIYSLIRNLNDEKMYTESDMSFVFHNFDRGDRFDTQLESFNLPI